MVARMSERQCAGIAKGSRTSSSLELHWSSTVGGSDQPSDSLEAKSGGSDQPPLLSERIGSGGSEAESDAASITINKTNENHFKSINIMNTIMTINENL